MRDSANVTLSLSKTQRKLPVPRAFFVSAKDTVLGKAYELSIAFVTARVMRALNRRYRGRNASTDILSFSLSPTSGEIVLCLQDVQAQAPLFGRSVPDFLKFLFIHGLLHLEGFDHGSRMEKQEQKFKKKFNL